MKEKQELLKEVDVDWLKEHYFSDSSHQIRLKEGDILLRPGDRNERLFLILEGTLAGYIESESGDRFEIFRSGRDQFVGTYSFFSKSHQSYSTVVAEEDCWLAYIDSDQPLVHDEEGRSFAEHFLPVVVNEIYMRQLSAQRMSIQNQAAMKRLYEAEKMATLGQMAAGLAHELNNAIGVINQKADWVAERAAEYIRNKDTEGLYKYFELGFEEGQRMSSADKRKRKKELEERYGLTAPIAKQLASTGLTDEELGQFAGKLHKSAGQIFYYFETGLALHDMLLAAHHAANVVKSVKELAVMDHHLLIDTDINQSIREALALLKEELRNIDLQLDLSEIPRVKTHPGELVQIWVNLIKNAAESLESNNQQNAQITVSSGWKNGFAKISVTDNGPGIPKELKSRIFQPNVTTKVKGLSFGLGLGLSIVQKLVESYNGKISVESQPGKTTFQMLLPTTTA